MKPNYILILCLVILLGTASNSYSQVRIQEVNKTTDVVTLKNFGSSAQDVSSWQFCSLFNYMQLSNLTVENGDLMLMPDNTVTLSGFSLADNEADLGLYESAPFNSANNMRDFLQWGSAGNGRENVADLAGIWNAGNFLPDASSYQYTGNGTQTGLAFWTTLSLDDLENEIEVNITPNPVVQNMNIQQKKAQLLDVQVFNLQGQLAKRTFVENENTSIDFSALSSGVYFIKLIDASNNTFTQKIVKQ